MINVSIYIQAIEGGIFERLDLFDDEKISITSSIQNINDLSKVFGDFSQSFTVPASKKNNRILKNWWENSIDNGFDARKRKNSYIELDTINFKNGKLQLEKSSFKEGICDSYTLTFFGSLVSLKDTFAGLLLKDLNTGEFDFSYSASSVRTKVTTQTTDNVKFPLISSQNAWTYAGISTVGGTINASELFPALRLRKVLELIENKFNITFEGYFIDTDSRFLNAYLLLKNAELFSIKYQPIYINYQTKVGTANYIDFNLGSGQMTFTANPTIQKRTVTINITNTVANIPFTLYCYKDGLVASSVKLISILGTQNALLFQKNGGDEDLSKYTFRVGYEGISSFTSNAILETTQSGIGATSMTITQSLSQTPSATINIASYMPDQKIEDFFSGILRMFNLTCYSEQENVYKIEQLESYYFNGNKVDLSKYIKTDKVDIDRSKLYNKINFQFEKSENLISSNYLSNNRISYGDLMAEFENDGSTYEIKLPFENILFSGVASNLSLGYLLKTDLKPYIPKPIILYDYGVLQTCPQFYFNGTSTTTYNAFGSETFIGGNTYSINFGSEQSPMTNNLISNSLYTQYYQAYLDNVFNQKARLIKLSAVLPISILTTLKLNDSIIIRDKKYIINTMTFDLTNGETSLELLTDFRELSLTIPVSSNYSSLHYSSLHYST